MSFAGACWTNCTKISRLKELHQVLLASGLTADTSDATATRAARGILLLAESNYEVNFAPDSRVSQRVLFLRSQSKQRNRGARFVRFHNDDGSFTYYATYTAYDGKITLPQLLETPDFVHFKFNTLNGPAVQNKGMALFPRKIKGQYVMLSRQDDENILIMFSDNIHFWKTPVLLLPPEQPWEFIKVGNCGSPIETEAGWLVLSHGVERCGSTARSLPPRPGGSDARHRTFANRCSPRTKPNGKAMFQTWCTPAARCCRGANSSSPMR